MNKNRYPTEPLKGNQNKPNKYGKKAKQLGISDNLKKIFDDLREIE